MATCITSSWVRSAPQAKVEAFVLSTTDTTATVRWTLFYVASSPAKTSVPKAYRVYVDGNESAHGTVGIHGKTGSYAVDSNTAVVQRDANTKSINFSVSFDFNLTWSGVYAGTKEAVGSLSIPGTSSSGSSGGDSGGTPGSGASSNAAIIEEFGLQTGTDRTVYATWKWTKENTENYQTKWKYYTGDNIWFTGQDTTVDEKQATYNAPSNATAVQLIVKPLSKKKMVNDQETSYWTANWSTAKTYYFNANPPIKPSAPNVEINDYTLTAELNNLDVNGTHIQFQVVRDNSTVFSTGSSEIVTSYAAYSCTVSPGSKYKVRCRSVRDELYSEWSEYSNNVNTIPSAPADITACRASSSSSVYLEWTAVENATQYDIEYTTKLEYFDGSNKTTVESGVEFTHYELTGLETGESYFFRVRATNEVGQSAWSGVKTVSIGKKPVSPTTWSSTTTVIVGEPLNLYWVHNAEDGSSQTYAELELIIDGVGDVYTIRNSTEEDEKDKTSVYSINTTGYKDGAKILWRVRTAGVTKEYGDWSVQRTVDVYAPPTLELTVTNADGESFDTLNSFPFYIRGFAGPKTQVPIGYHLVIVSTEIYETVDSVGNVKVINSGEAVYSKYFDTSDILLVEMLANNVDLENNIKYTVTCTVTMNSGLTVAESSEFTVGWTDVQFAPNASIAIDSEALAAYICPYCEDQNGMIIDGVFLSVYRREYDGTFTEIAKNLDNSKTSFVTDPHPALDYARYRIVAMTRDTGAVSYYDVPPQPIGETAVIIQWAEDWTSFNSENEDPMVQPPWSGSMLRLPYNVDVSNKHAPDVALVEYIGRRHPVSYYGTQRGEAATWNIAIDKKDRETLYALRRLAIWQGDVYVREPSGSGYWANINVSFSQKHMELIIPVTLEIVRVEGGV